MNNGHYRGGWHGPAAYPPMFPPVRAILHASVRPSSWPECHERVVMELQGLQERLVDMRQGSGWMTHHRHSAILAQAAIDACLSGAASPLWRSRHSAAAAAAQQAVLHPSARGAGGQADGHHPKCGQKVHAGSRACGGPAQQAVCALSSGRLRTLCVSSHCTAVFLGRSKSAPRHAHVHTTPLPGCPRWVQGSICCAGSADRQVSWYARKVLQLPLGIWLCRVSIFVVATEDAGKGCQITQLKGTPNEPIAYEKRVSEHAQHIWEQSLCLEHQVQQTSFLIQFVLQGPAYGSLEPQDDVNSLSFGKKMTCTNPSCSLERIFQGQRDLRSSLTSAFLRSGSSRQSLGTHIP